MIALPVRTATCIVCGAPARPDEYPARPDEYNAGHRLNIALCGEVCAVRLQESARRNQ